MKCLLQQLRTTQCELSNILELRKVMDFNLTMFRKKLKKVAELNLESVSLHDSLNEHQGWMILILNGYIMVLRGPDRILCLIILQLKKEDGPITSSH